MLVPPDSHKFRKHICNTVEYDSKTVCLCVVCTLNAYFIYCMEVHTDWQMFNKFCPMYCRFLLSVFLFFLFVFLLFHTHFLCATYKRHTGCMVKILTALQTIYIPNIFSIGLNLNAPVLKRKTGDDDDDDDYDGKII